MNKYITLFKVAGRCIVNITEIFKDWNKSFSITQTSNRKCFLSNTGKKDGFRCEISYDQASEIIEKLGLIFVENSMVKNAGAYYDAATAQAELRRLTETYNKKIQELKILDEIIQTYITAL